MSEFKLVAEVRNTIGKEKARKLRKAGRFPAVIYGPNMQAVSLDLDTRETELTLQRIHGEKVLVDLQYGGKTDRVFVRNVQRDPVTEALIHVDFYCVDLTREMDTWVPVRAIGTPLGVKLGGLLEAPTRTLHIRCLPTNVPPHIDVNVENLDGGHAVHVRDLAEIAGVKLLNTPDTVVFHVVGKQKEEVVAAPAAAAPAKGKAAPAKAAPAAAPAKKK